jgi:nucleoside-diphosphate-sugar epimerase
MHACRGVPDYFPTDHDHPPRPTTPYGTAKLLIKEKCRCFTVSMRIATICLRPQAMLGLERWAKFAAAREANLEAEWDLFSEYRSFIDPRDVAAAVICAPRCPAPAT